MSTPLRSITLGSALILLAVVASSLLLPGCKHMPPDAPMLDEGTPPAPVDTTPVDTTPTVICDPDTVYFVQDILPLVIAACTGVGSGSAGCHNAAHHAEGVRLYDYAHIVNYVQPGSPNQSELYGISQNGEMPPNGYPNLTSAQLQLMYTWIQQGALNNSCIPSACDTSNVTYNGTVKTILSNKCNGCHSGSNPSGGVSTNTWAAANGIAMDGRLAGTIQHLSGYNAMPPSGGMLPQCQIDQIMIWIQGGAQNN